MPTTTYRWDSPYDWLESATWEWSKERLRTEFLDLARKVDSDTLQDIYQADMEYDGYFKPLISDETLATLRSRRFTLDGDPIDDMQEFLDDNEFEPKEINQLAVLEIGREIVFGGGAAAEFVVQRVA